MLNKKIKKSTRDAYGEELLSLGKNIDDIRYDTYIPVRIIYRIFSTLLWDSIIIVTLFFNSI